MSVDIEDLVESVSRRNAHNKIIKHCKNLIKSSKTNNINDKIEETVEDVRGNFLEEEKYKVFCKTWGCCHNTSDSEYMLGLLSESGYTITDDLETADIWLLNSCTVKTPAEDQFRHFITEGKALGKKMILAGCVPQAEPNASFLDELSVVGVTQIHRIVEVADEVIKGNRVVFNETNHLDENCLNLPKIRRNPLIEIIAINSGCLNNCTYCKTKLARGQLRSFPIRTIVNRAKEALADGVKEIWLTSEDLGAYGRDIGVNIVNLLEALIRVIPDGCMLRLGMTNPPYILEHLNEIAKILQDERVFSFIHIPVQSGSNNVLTDMKREYCIEDFIYLVKTLRERVPGIYIATDIICGYPTETEEDFKCTLDLIKEFRFPSLFINKFYSRQGTVASKLPQISSQEKKRRTKLADEIFRSYSTYTEFLGSFQRILVTEVGHDGFHLVGHNKTYQQILVKPQKKDDLMGKWVTVRITQTGKHYMHGEIIAIEENNTAFSHKTNKFRRTRTIILTCILLICFAHLTSSIYLRCNK